MLTFLLSFASIYDLLTSVKERLPVGDFPLPLPLPIQLPEYTTSFLAGAHPCGFWDENQNE